MSNLTWLVVASTDKALIYLVDRLKHQLIHELDHAEGRMKTKDLLTGKAGHYLAPRSDAHENEHVYFAHELAAFLDDARNKNEYAALIICAEPHFSGLLEQELSKPVKELIKKHIHKDYLSFPGAKLDEAVAELVKGLLF